MRCLIISSFLNIINIIFRMLFLAKQMFGLCKIFPVSDMCWWKICIKHTNTIIFDYLPKCKKILFSKILWHLRVESFSLLPLFAVDIIKSVIKPWRIKGLWCKNIHFSVQGSDWELRAFLWRSVRHHGSSGSWIIWYSSLLLQRFWNAVCDTLVSGEDLR